MAILGVMKTLLAILKMHPLQLQILVPSMVLQSMYEFFVMARQGIGEGLLYLASLEHVGHLSNSLLFDMLTYS